MRIARVKNVPFQPATIDKLATTPAYKQVKHPGRVALLRRTTGLIEIYNPEECDWYLEKVLHVSGLPEVRDLLWTPVLEGESLSLDSGNSCTQLCSFATFKHVSKAAERTHSACWRLLTAHADGLIREWDWQGSGMPLKSSSVNASAAWCMSLSPDAKCLAVGHEDGKIRIYALYNSDGHSCLDWTKSVMANYEDLKSGLSKSVTRVIFIQWTESALVSGSNSSALIKFWDPVSGASLGHASIPGNHYLTSMQAHLIKVDREEQAMLMTGDTEGQLTIWDLSTQSPLQTLQVLTPGTPVLCLTSYSTLAYASGIDQRTVQLHCAPVTLASGVQDWRWNVTHACRIHTHDVLTLATLRVNHKSRHGWLLLSGGVDTNLLVADAARAVITQNDRRLPDWPFTLTECVRNLPMSGLNVALVNHRRRFELFNPGTGLVLTQLNTPALVQTWQVYEKMQTNDSLLVTLAVVFDHTIFKTYSIQLKLQNLSWQVKEIDTKVVATEELASEDCQVDCIKELAFSENHADYSLYALISIKSMDKFFGLSERGGDLRIWHYTPIIAVLQKDSLECVAELDFDPLPGFLIVIDQGFLLLIDSSSFNVILLNCGIKTNIAQLPCFPVAWCQAAKAFFVLCADHSIHYINATSMTTISLPSSWFSSTTHQRFHHMHYSKSTNSLYLIGYGTIVQFTQVLLDDDYLQVRQEFSVLESATPENKNEQRGIIRVYKEYKYILDFAPSINTESAVLVQREWTEIFDALPAPFYRPKYGVH